MDKDIKKKGSKKHKVGLQLVVLSVLIAALAAFATGVYQGRIPFALKMAERYSVRGVDISYYQGDVDWQVLENGLSFVYMKATEGSGHQDIRLEEIMAGALETVLPVGAFH
ncbi:MAG: hypothetical protein K2K17_03230 [Lachnospiraceae bacterium]|nr:hypothetical protein [Lachnospiraceae bacterium]